MQFDDQAPTRQRHADSALWWPVVLEHGHTSYQPLIFLLVRIRERTLYTSNLARQRWFSFSWGFSIPFHSLHFHTFFDLFFSFLLSFFPFFFSFSFFFLIKTPNENAGQPRQVAIETISSQSCASDPMRFFIFTESLHCTNHNGVPCCCSSCSPSGQWRAGRAKPVHIPWLDHAHAALERHRWKPHRSACSWHVPSKFTCTAVKHRHKSGRVLDTAALLVAASACVAVATLQGSSASEHSCLLALALALSPVFLSPCILLTPHTCTGPGFIQVVLVRREQEGQ